MNKDYEVIEDDPEAEKKFGCGWNHRVLVHFHNNEPYFKIHDVYYGVDGVPNSYGAEAETISCETIKGMRWTLNKMKECLKKPILMAGDEFPKEYIIETNENNKN